MARTTQEGLASLLALDQRAQQGSDPISAISALLSGIGERRASQQKIGREQDQQRFLNNIKKSELFSKTFIDLSERGLNAEQAEAQAGRLSGLDQDPDFEFIPKESRDEFNAAIQTSRDRDTRLTESKIAANEALAAKRRRKSGGISTQEALRQLIDPVSASQLKNRPVLLQRLENIIAQELQQPIAGETAVTQAQAQPLAGTPQLGQPQPTQTPPPATPQLGQTQVTQEEKDAQDFQALIAGKKVGDKFEVSGQNVEIVDIDPEGLPIVQTSKGKLKLMGFINGALDAERV